LNNHTLFQLFLEGLGFKETGALLTDWEEKCYNNVKYVENYVFLDIHA